MPPSSQTKIQRKLMILHGNRQTGEILIARMEKLRRKLRGVKNFNDDDVLHFEFVAPDAPHSYLTSDRGDDEGIHEQGDDIKDGINEQVMRTWWHLTSDDEGRKNNEFVYDGIEESLIMLHDIWLAQYEKRESGRGRNRNSDCEIFEGLFGFSQGARLIYIISVLHNRSRGNFFPGLRFVIFSGGYGDVPLPVNLNSIQTRVFQHYNIEDSRFKEDTSLSLPSLHIIGLRDKFVLPEQSRALARNFNNPQVYEFEGGHYVPMKAKDCEVIISFIFKHAEQCPLGNSENDIEQLRNSAESDHECTAPFESSKCKTSNEKEIYVPPDEEHAMEHISEVEALEAIYPDEFRLLSPAKGEMEERQFAHPIEYTILLHDPEEINDDGGDTKCLWPPDRISLRVKYPSMYPEESPSMSLDHSMNVMQFSSRASEACLSAVQSAARLEEGMPCVMTCVLAAKEFFENGGLNAVEHSITDAALEKGSEAIVKENCKTICDNGDDTCVRTILGIRADSERVRQCDKEGQEIANRMLSRFGDSALETSVVAVEEERSENNCSSYSSSYVTGGGGSWKYTIGLVGKPSAGKSTFFNVATAFARQRDDGGGEHLGASMAPHPFTTIDPNVGYCYLPAPFGACPEDNLNTLEERLRIGSMHGRDPTGRRMLFATLKDVAGLVPGAYQGRGKGNKFLDDLTDADVLIHVVDGSGTADTEGNRVGVEGGVHPLTDLAWVRNEVLEWISSNLEAKWQKVTRKGHDKLAGMFSGYKQNQAFVWNVLLQIEKFMESHYKVDRALDHLELWDGGDMRRLVNAFLGVRFPMALALNKYDLPSSVKYAKDIEDALPIHGAHSSTPLSAKNEMEFVRDKIMTATGNTQINRDKQNQQQQPPQQVWSCLQSAMSLRQPVLVFPVVDMATYESLPGMMNTACRDASLPSAGFIGCLEAAGGQKPTLWDPQKHVYQQHTTSQHAKPSSTSIRNRQSAAPNASTEVSQRSHLPSAALRDCIMMKPGSKVEDVFLTLKGLGALRGDYVRAEGACNIGDKSRLLRKDEFIGLSNRIIKIMTNKKC